jgi:phosphoribosyl 1,2-cyclic phosphodiesterase
LRFTLLGSGSSGNVAFLESSSGGVVTRVLVDAGLSRAEIEARLLRVPGVAASPDAPLEFIDAVLVTHDHSDHVGCAGSLGRPIWATAGTRRAAQLEAQLVRAGERFRVGALEVDPVLLPHDAEETVGYVISDGRARVGILTDCGHDAPEVAEAYAGCDLLVLETNHDATLLQHGPYPPSLKRRVGGRRGHLSNDQSASLLRMMLKLGPAPKLVVAAHLSQANNRPQLAKSALDRVLGRAGRVIVATQSRGCPLLLVEDGRVSVVPDRNEQLSFDFNRRVVGL